MNVHYKSADIRSKKKNQEPPSPLQIQYWRSPNLQELHKFLENKNVHKDWKTDYKQDQARDLQLLQYHKHSGKVEKSLKLPSNVKKKKLHKQKKENTLA